MDGSGFRHLYAPAGPEGYYRAHADDYHNPHEPVIRLALAHAVQHWSPPLRFDAVLDLAAGGGEATLALRELLEGIACEGMDPFTAELYRRRTGLPCQAVSFEQLASGAQVLADYSCIVCSCALHLASESWLPVLCQVLSRAAPDLLILTPLRRPLLREAWGWRLEAESTFAVDDRDLRLRWYRSCWTEP